MKKLNSVKAKLFAVFLAMILLLLSCFGLLFFMLDRYTVNAIYQQMESSAQYYANFVDYQMENIMLQRDDFFTDWNLVFLSQKGNVMDPDRMAAILTEQEKLLLIKGSDKLVKDVSFYIFGSNYVIKSDDFRIMTDEDRIRVEDMNSRLDILAVKDGVLTLAMAEHYYSEKMPPKFYLEIIFDNEQMIDHLRNFSIEGGSSFWDYPQIGWFLEDPMQEGMGHKILKELGESQEISKIRVDGDTYLVNVTESKYFGNLVQYCSEEVILHDLRNYVWLMIGFLILALACALIFSSYTEKLVNRPLRKLHASLRKLEEGDLTIQIRHESEDEFEYIYDGFNHMVQKLSKTIDEVYFQKRLVTEARFRQLQAQINPHFLYNSFFLLSGRIRRSDYKGAEILADYLGTYFRYITRNTSDIAKLSEELEHAEAYARIQESRFSSRIELIWEALPLEAENILVPRLIIQPLLENAFKYGLEEKEEDGILHVYFQREGEIQKIFIEDNGDTPDAVISSIQEKLSDDYKGEVTGIVNVNRRLRNYFKNKGGLSIQRGGLGGVLVTVNLPYEKGETECFSC